MRVLVDLIFFTGTKGGMESYVRQLYGAFSDEDLEGVELIGLASAELSRTGAPWFPGELLDSGISGESRAAWARGELVAVAGFARRHAIDLIHCPANFGPAHSRVPFVLTVHDLLPFRFPEYVPGPYSAILRTMIRVAARHAARVVTVSEASAEDIVRYLRIPRQRVDVVPSAGSGGTPAAVRRLDGQLLALGNRMPHKNFPLLLESLAQIAREKRPRLVIPGGPAPDPLADRVRDLGLDAWVTLEGWLPDNDVSRLYAESTLLVVPTLFEGFGLPVLEAMSMGCPVLCSDIPVLREVGGDAAAYADPRDSAAFARAIAELLADPQRRAQMAERGRVRAASFSWRRAALSTLDSFRSAEAHSRTRRRGQLQKRPT